MTTFCFRRYFFLFFSLAAGFLYFLQGNALAQVPSDAQTGAVQKQIDIQDAAPLDDDLLGEKDVPEIEVPEEPEEEVETDRTIFIKEIRLRGNTVFSDTELRPVVVPFEGKELGFKELNALTRALGDYYRKKGYFLARAYILEQEIVEGRIDVTILEGRLGKVLIRNNKYYDHEFIRNHFRAEEGGILQQEELIRSLMLLNENLNLVIRAALIKGKEPGTADIILTAEDTRTMQGYVDFNNFGSRFTAKSRFGSLFNFSNVLLAGDVLSVRGMFGNPLDSLQYTNGEYEFFVNRYGSRIKFSYSWLNFDAKRELKDLLVSGESRIAGMDFTHPVLRSRNTNIDVGLGFDRKEIEEFLLGELSSNDDLRTGRLEFNIDSIDRFSGRNYVAGVYTTGIGEHLGAMKNDDPQSSRAGADNLFQKMALSYTRVQKMPEASFLILRAGGQYASDDLVAAEQMSIGGADTVRGYPSSEYLGDFGYNLGMELRTQPYLLRNLQVPFWDGHKFRDILQYVFFFDHGSVYFKNPQPGEKKSRRISGAGAGIRLNLPQDFSVRIDVGLPLFDPQPKDGSNTQVYIQVGKKLF